MSIAARLALALVVLAILAGGVVIFYVLPQLESTETAAPSAPPPEPKPETVAAASSAQPAAPVPPPAAPVPPPETATPPVPPAGSDNTTPPPSQVPTDQPPAPTSPDQPPAGSNPAPVPDPNAPIPLTPTVAAPSQSAAPGPAAAPQPFDPALPGVGNVAVAVNQSLVMAGTADARTEPRADAPVLVRLDKGSPITVTAVMAGQLWLQVELSDRQTAYIPAAALPQAVSVAGPGAGGSGGASAVPGTAAATPSFMSDAETLRATARTPLYAAPQPGAAVQGVLPAGTQVQIVAKTTDGQWGWVQTADGSPAYVRMATLSGVAAPAAALPDTIAGRVKVLTTASLVVDGHRIALYGIKGKGGVYATQLRALIQSHGGVLSCARRDALYVCSLPGDIDIARAALYNGGATVADDASPDYREQADAARAARRGLWAR